MTNEELVESGDREHKLFMKTLKRQFEDAEVKAGEELPLPNGNSTGSLSLDIDLKVPIYEGGIVEIFSNSGAGKTTLVLSILSEAVKRGKRVLFIDQEQALQPTLVDSFPNLRKEGALTVMTLPTGEEALRCAEMWALQYPGAIVAIDSVDALLPKQTDDKDLGETDVGTLPKLMSAGCRKIMSAVGKSKSTVVFLNQLRSKIGAYGNPDTTSGGRALPFYSAQRIQLMDITSKTRLMNDEGRQIGHTVRYKVIKNKVEAPFVEGEFPLIYGKGIDRFTELTGLAVDYGVLEKAEKGNYIMVPNAKGELVKKPPKTVADMLRSDPELYESVLGEVKALFPETFSE